MTRAEVKIIKNYVKEKNIKQIKNIKNGQIENSCPFRNNIDKKCMIYEVRPELCRDYKCWDLTISDFIEKYIEDESYSTYCGHETFFNDPSVKARYFKEQHNQKPIEVI